MFKELEIVELLKKSPVLFLEQSIGQFDADGKQQYKLTFDQGSFFDVGSHLWIDQISEFNGLKYYMLKPFPGEGVSVQRSMTGIYVDMADSYMKSTGNSITCFCSLCKEGNGKHENGN